MKKTTNYQLNQWEKTDRIMMEDFNTDNQKLETALTALDRSAHFQTLFDETVTEDTNHFSVPLSGIDWSAWRALHFEIYPAADTSPSLLLCFNDVQQNKICTLPTTPCRLILLPFGRDSFALAYLLLEKGFFTPVCRNDIVFSQLQSIDISRTDLEGFLLKAGSRVVLLGEAM